MRQLEELEGRQVERDRIREVRIDDDRIPALVVSLQEPAPVLDRDAEPRAARESEISVGDVADDRVQLDDLKIEAGEVPPEAFLHRAAAEPDEEDPPRPGPIGEGQLQEVGVRVAGAEGIVQVHPALKRALEAQMPRLAVLDHRQPVVARVLRVDELEALGGDRDLPLAELPVPGRPVLCCDPRQAPALFRLERNGRPDGRGCERGDDQAGGERALSERDEPSGNEESSC
jgi:hypothetical protein